MKRRQTLIIGWALSLVLLVGCSTPSTPDVDKSSQESTTPATRTLSNDLTDGYYQTIVPFVSSETRGLVYTFLSNRFDIEELELSLMRASTSFFDPEEVFFQDGQLLSRDLVTRLLRSQLTEKQLKAQLKENENFVDVGLNPTSDVERTIGETTVSNITDLAYLLEQNFVTIDEEGNTVLEGVSIGLALNPFHTETNEETSLSTTLQKDEDDLIAEGQEIAQRLIEILRMQEGLEEVPIMIGLYILESNTAVVPGRMVSKTLVDANSDNIRSWETVEERHFLLQSDSRVSDYDLDILDEFDYFQDTINRYYPHIYGIIGIAHFIDRSLNNLEITVNTEFFGLTEKLSLHQIVGEVITEFSPSYNVTVIIRSSSEVFGIVQRPANGEVTVQRINW